MHGKKPCRELSAVEVYLIGSEYVKTLQTVCLSCNRAWSVAPYSILSKKVSTGSPTHACGHSGDELKDSCTSTRSLFPSSLRKRVGQKGAEVARNVREMSETLPIFSQSQIIMTKQSAHYSHSSDFSSSSAQTRILLHELACD